MWNLLAPFLLCLSSLTHGSQGHEITYPERLHHSRHKRDLSTAIADGHEDAASFAVNAFNERFILDTKNNRQLIPESFQLRQFDSDDNEIISREYPETCHFQGSIRGNPDSVVVLNTCSGLKGVIDDGERTYHIQPHDDDKENGAHKIHLADDEEQFDAHKHCGTSDHEVSLDSTSKESKIKRTINRIRRNIGHVVNLEEVYRPYLTTNETRYNEVMFVVDNGIYQRYNNNSKTVLEKVATLCNAVDAVYQRINIRIVMAAIEIWTNGDRMERKDTGGGELGSFGTYRKTNLIGKIKHDNAQFLSHHGWGNVAGMAWVGTMCGSLSAGVNAWSFGSIIGPLVVVAHEMGHNFRFNHNTDECKCLTPKGCFMGGHKTRVPGFSDCNLNSLKKINDKCLYNVPEKAYNARCGNGIREGDEECDCGTPEMCAAKDPCCIPHDCRLKPSSQCSDLHHTCCSSCLFKKQGTLCRATKTDCDVPEHCTGDSGDCPSNNVMQDGTPCNRTNKLILANTNRGSVVTRKLRPAIQARYIRINPQYWNGWTCMRTELLGCSADEINPTIPTPIKPYNDYCVVPKNATCNPHDNSRIVFKSGYLCREKHMEFQLDANGILWHACSNKRICPENGNTGNGVKLVISSICKDEDSKFVRTTGHSLKHVKSGKCIHPNGGWPGNDRELVLWGGCDSTRLELWFMKPDCLMPLGMRSGEIKNSQITASSMRKTSEHPKYARLHNSKYWCAAKKEKSEYLQIDLGKTQTIAHVQTQGRGNWYDWVRAYYIYYSEDNYRWIGYSERGDVAHSNSYCYLGKCAETRDTQCRDLWGPDANNGADGCYDKLNTEAQGYGTCDPFSNSSCTAKDVQCGQIQCQSQRNTPSLVNYGKSYTKVSVGDSQCSAAVLDNTDSVGNGMVLDGTKCGDGKMCSNFQCKTFSELNLACPMVNGKVCNEQGDCTSKGECQCYEGYDPKTNCVQGLVAVDGGFSSWSAWSTCTVGCNGGKQQRYRFCNNPFPKHGGKDCGGDLEEEQNCKTAPCPKAHSCRHLQLISMSVDDEPLPDGVYDIYPHGLSKQPIKTYCDMSRDGGGWTLLVTSHTNSWTANDVILKNPGNPSLIADFSILKYADDIKNHLNVIGGTFEYRLEAQRPGRWGGIWEVDRPYTFTAKTNSQTNVKLLKKFDNWSYKNSGIEKRMPWISGAKLTTSASATSNWWGSITGNEKNYHPAPWISGSHMESQPEYIWYWMREGPWKLPRSCLEIQMRGLQTRPYPDGVYSIKPPGKQLTKTYCDMTSRGGGWTLLVTSKTHAGWTQENVKSRNADKPSLDSDYSILAVADAIKDFDPSQEFFQYRIEADGVNQNGGIFDAPSDYTFTSTCDQQVNVSMVENFSKISSSSNLAKRMPRLEMSSSVFLATGSNVQDASGSLVYNDGSSDSPSYLPSVNANPGVVRYWMREGTRRSCFDIKIHGERKSQSYQDDYYMVRFLNGSSYLPVFCDMTSDPGAYTLVVTSRHNSWKREQVPARNVYRPSLNDDYSILKYADLIKNMGHNATFKYKLDANQRGHWGGVWAAPHKYSFMSTSNGQTGVTLIQKFDSWTLSWWKSVQNRMPYFDAKGTHTKALLTTSSSRTYYPAGSIIWGDKQYNPAYWMRFGDMLNPGVIWYWVNEDDCDADRQPVDGGLTEWGAWEKCDKLCANGKQRRYKTCTNPAPRCGGKPCDASQPKVEVKDCYTCPESPIKSYGGYCVQPKSADCHPPENTPLVLTKADANCSADYMNFLFDSDGIIYQKCSGKRVCPEDNNVSNNKKLLLKDECPENLSKHRRLSSKSLQNLYNKKCVHPLYGWPGEGVYLIYYGGCSEDRLKLDFFKLP